MSTEVFRFAEGHSKKVRFGCLFVLLAVLLMLTGCWSRKEMNEITFIVGMAIDKADDRYKTTVQVVDPSQMTNNRRADRIPMFTYTETGRTVDEALRKMSTKSPRLLYGGHMMFLVISEELARKGFEEAIDFFSRDPNYRANFYVAVANGNSAEEIMNLITPFEILPAQEYAKSLKLSEVHWAPSAATLWIDFMRNIVTPGRENALTGITLKGDLEQGRKLDNVRVIKNLAEFQFKNLAVFKEQKMVGWLNENESKAYTFVNNRVKNTVGVISCPDGGKVDIKVTRARSKIEPRVVEGKPQLKVKVFVEGDANELSCSLDMTKGPELSKIQQLGQDELTSIIEGGIKGVQTKYGADIFGFGEAFYRRYPQRWKEWAPNWGAMFKELQVEVVVEYRLRKMGKITQPLTKQP
jgi:spore germination protein KC